MKNETRELIAQSIELIINYFDHIKTQTIIDTLHGSDTSKLLLKKNSRNLDMFGIKSK